MSLREQDKDPQPESPPKMLKLPTEPTSAKMPAEPRAFVLSQRPASPIAISSDEDESTDFETKSDIETATPHPLNMANVPIYRGPDYVASSKEQEAPPQMRLPTYSAVPDDKLPKAIDDCITTGIDYLKQLRENDALNIDQKFRAKLLDPLPGHPKPQKILTAKEVPDKLFEYLVSPETCRLIHRHSSRTLYGPLSIVLC